jgi:cobalt/nickel transport system permease protein
MYAATAAAAGYSINKVRKDDNPAKLPVMAVTSALVFAGQMINYTIPGTGSSGHMCGGMLLSALLGPEAGFLSMIVILAIQCLFFADGTTVSCRHSPMVSGAVASDGSMV